MFFYVATAVFCGLIALISFVKYLFADRGVKPIEFVAMIVLALVTFYCISMALGQGV